MPRLETLGGRDLLAILSSDLSVFQDECVRLLKAFAESDDEYMHNTKHSCIALVVLAGAVAALGHLDGCQDDPRKYIHFANLVMRFGEHAAHAFAEEQEACPELGGRPAA